MTEREALEEVERTLTYFSCFGTPQLKTCLANIRTVLAASNQEAWVAALLNAPNPAPEPCPYCSDGKRTGLPGNACENCMNTGLKYPERAAAPAVSGEQQKGLTWGIGSWSAAALEDPEINDETKANIRAWLAESEEKAANIICGDVCQHPDICNGKEDTWCWKKVKEFSTATPAGGGEALEPFNNELARQERVRNYRDGDCYLVDCRVTIGDLRRLVAAQPASPLRVQETCIECGKCDPCDYDCPNYIDDQPPSPLRDDALEEAAQYHDRNAADCRAIALVNLDNDLGADSKTHAVDHEIAAEDIRAMKGSPPEQPHKIETDGPACPTCGFKIRSRERRPFVIEDDAPPEQPAAAPEAWQAAVDLTEKSILSEYYSGLLNGDHRIKEGFKNLRAALFPTAPAKSSSGDKETK